MENATGRIIDVIRTGVGRFVAFYLRHPAGFLVAAVAWWGTFVITLTLFFGIPFRYSVETGLEIAFAITAPPDAVSNQYREVHHISNTPFIVQVVGAAGWTVIVFFTFLIPALVAAMIDRLPRVVLTLRSLMNAEVWGFFKRYADLLAAYTTIMVEGAELSRDGDSGVGQLLRDNRVQVLGAVASVTTYWYRERIDLNANASFMRVIQGADSTDPSAPVLYSNATAGAHVRLLELDGWAHLNEGLPQTLLLPLDDLSPRPGAPYAVVHGEFDVVSDAQDADEWNRRGETPGQIDAEIGYFKQVQFRSFLSIPVHDMTNQTVIGALTVQVDKPGIFEHRNPETADLVEMLGRFCYFLAWLERKSKND
jgi:hypothetical protein